MLLLVSTLTDQQRERFTRRHTLTVLPLPLESEDPAHNSRAAKRFTMDFSLLSTCCVSERDTHIAAKSIQVDLTEFPLLGSEMLCVCVCWLSICFVVVFTLKLLPKL